MNPLEIQSVDVYVVGPQVERFRFSSDMGAVFETLTIVKVTTVDGGTGIGGVTLFSENSFDGSLGESLKTLCPAILGRSVDDPAAITQHLLRRYNSMTPMPQGGIDIALWDRLAKHQQQPLYRALGGTRANMPAYASLPLADTPQAYVDAIEGLIHQYRFDAFKLHGWCMLEPDLALIRALKDAFGNRNLRFILDLEERYTLEDSLTIAKALNGLDCAWIEAPLPDTDLSSYQMLRLATSIPIIPAGNTLDSIGLIKLGVEAGAWDGVRVDANYAGGITLVNEMMRLGEAHNLPTELQAWGYTLSQAANLHLSLAHPSTQYFELPVPYEPHEACAKRGLRAVDGIIEAPQEAGLGIDIDWDAVDRDLLSHYQIVK